MNSLTLNENSSYITLREQVLVFIHSLWLLIDNKTRALVYYLSKIQGLSIRQIAKRCNVPRATVWRISKIDLSSNQRSTKGKERRGRPRKLNARLERKLRRSIQVLRER